MITLNNYGYTLLKDGGRIKDPYRREQWLDLLFHVLKDLDFNYSAMERFLCNEYGLDYHIYNRRTLKKILLMPEGYTAKQIAQIFKAAQKDKVLSEHLSLYFVKRIVLREQERLLPD